MKLGVGSELKMEAASMRAWRWVQSSRVLSRGLLPWNTQPSFYGPASHKPQPEISLASQPQRHENKNSVVYLRSFFFALIKIFIEISQISSRNRSFFFFSK